MLNRDSMAPSFRTDLSQITAWLENHAASLPELTMVSSADMALMALRHLAKELDYYFEQQEKTA